MRIPLDLSRHCIQTEIKRVYERAVSDYFRKAKPDPLLEERIEALQQALVSLDFPSLRGAWPALAGEGAGPVHLELEAGELTIVMGEAPAEVRIPCLTLKREEQ